MIKLIKHYQYREAIGSCGHEYDGRTFNEYSLAVALWQSVGLKLDNHSAIVINVNGVEEAWYWSDNTLTKAKRLVAGDGNREKRVLSVVWEEKVNTKN